MASGPVETIDLNRVSGLECQWCVRQGKQEPHTEYWELKPKWELPSGYHMHKGCFYGQNEKRALPLLCPISGKVVMDIGTRLFVEKGPQIKKIVTIEGQVPDSAVMADGIHLYFKVRFSDGKTGLVVRDMCRLAESSDTEGPFPLTKEQVYPQYFARDKKKLG